MRIVGRHVITEYLRSPMMMLILVGRRDWRDGWLDRLLRSGGGRVARTANLTKAMGCCTRSIGSVASRRRRRLGINVSLVQRESIAGLVPCTRLGWMLEEAVLGSALQAKAAWCSGHLLNEPDAIVPNQMPLCTGSRRRAAQPRQI
jgi:hypothetical protein